MEQFNHQLPDYARTDEQREKLRSIARRSTLFVGKWIIGFVDMTAPLHTEMCKWIDSEASIRKLGLVPRDHLKTSTWTIANSVKRIICNPNIRILLGNETATNASHFLRRIQAIWQRNQIFQWMFPELIPDWSSRSCKWSETEMQVPREVDYPESTIETIGVGGAVVSRHYNLIKLDDLVGKEASESAEVMRKTIDWYQYCESLLESPKDHIEVYGTRWAYSDLYAWIEKNEAGFVDIFFRRVFDTKGDPIWPERFDAEALARLRKKLGTFKFSCQYENDPRDPESGSFERKTLRWWKWANGLIHPQGSTTFIDPEGLSCFMRVDPAISERPGAARSAIVVDGVYKDDRVFLLDAWAKRCQPFEMIDKIFELYKKWNCEMVGIEAVAYQKVLKPVLEREAEQRGSWLNVVECRPDSRERKENRIRGRLEPIFERGLYWVREDQEDWLEEFDQFPHGATCDLLDATANGPEMWVAPGEDGEDESPGDTWNLESQFEGRSTVTGY